MSMVAQKFLIMPPLIEHNSRNVVLDSLKGWAILGIVLFHSTSFSDLVLPSYVQTFISQGSRGVQVFFILSAISLSLSWQKYCVGLSNYLHFCFHRLKRLAPPYYLTLAIWLVINAPPLHIPQIIAILTFANSFIPSLFNIIFPGSWFIPVLIFFSLLFPFLYPLFADLKKAGLLLMVSFLVSQGIRLFLLENPLTSNQSLWSDFSYLFPISQLPVFCVGLTLAHILKKSQISDQDKRTILLFGFGIFILVAVQLLLPLEIISGHYLFSIFFTCLALLLFKYPHWLIVNRFASKLGKSSYGIYLIHMLILYLGSKYKLFPILPVSDIFQFCIRFIVTLAISFMIAVALEHITKKVFK